MVEFVVQDNWAMAICRKCDLIKPEHQQLIGPEIDGSQCPECGRPLFVLYKEASGASVYK